MTTSKSCDVNKMTIAELRALPAKDREFDLIELDGLVLLPTRRTTIGGFRIADVVVMPKGGEPFRMAGVNVDGLRIFQVLGGMISIDWLPRSGAMHLFSMGDLIMTCTGMDIMINGREAVFQQAIGTAAA